MTALLVNGAKAPEERFKDIVLEIRDEKYLITQDGKTASRRLRLDPAKKPKAIDITYDDGPNKGKTNRGVYRIDGDTLTICRHEQPDMPRPGDFNAPAGSGRALVVFQRIK